MGFSGRIGLERGQEYLPANKIMSTVYKDTHVIIQIDYPKREVDSMENILPTYWTDYTTIWKKRLYLANKKVYMQGRLLPSRSQDI